MPVDPLRNQMGFLINVHMHGYFEFAIAIDLCGNQWRYFFN